MSKIIFGLPRWSLDSTCLLIARVARGLGARGWQSGVLFTERGISRVIQPSLDQRPPQWLRWEDLPQSPKDDWEGGWDALIRYLEQAAPCIYVMSSDLRANVVAPRLSDNVILVGLVWTEFGPDFQQAKRLGAFWNVAFTCSKMAQFRLSQSLPKLAPRLVGISDTMSDDELVSSWEWTLERAHQMCASGWFARPLGPLCALSETTAKAALVNNTPFWPKRVFRREKVFSRIGGVPPNMKVIFALPGGQISGVDIFTVNLVRELCRRGVPTKIVGLRKLRGRMGLALDADLPLDELGVQEGLPDRISVRALRSYLESQGPCVFLPNYFFSCASVLATLPRCVRSIGICHSDDPAHYAHQMRYGSNYDAVVGVSQAIVSHLGMLDPSLRNRLTMIPYGVPVRHFQRTIRAGEPLRILFSGRLLSYQKRVHDLIEIASQLTLLGCFFRMDLIGEGDEFSALGESIKIRALQDRVFLLGKLSNSELLQRLPEYHAYLLPSSFEGLSVGLLEAMGSGLVPVVSRIRSGVPELIQEGRNGLTAPVGDINGFARHLKTLRDHPEMLQRLGDNARATILAGGYTIQDMTERYLEVFQRVAAQSSVGSLAPYYEERAKEMGYEVLAWVRDFAHGLE